MSEIEPPTPFPLNPIFNVNDWVQNNTLLTISQANKLYLRKSGDTATGLINFSGGLTCSGLCQISCNVVLNGTNNYIQYSDNSQQLSAYTGAKNLAGSYTLTNMTVDSNGKITALSSGSSTNQFQPTFYNMSFQQFSTTAYGYEGAFYINFSGSWAITDWICFRITCRMSWGTNQTSLGVANGLLYFQPYYIPQSGNWAPLNGYGTTLKWASGSGSYYGANSGVWFVSSGNTGNTGYMYIYGVGWNNIQLMFESPAVAGGFQGTLTLEYMSRSLTGGNHQVVNGSGTYNTLP